MIRFVCSCGKQLQAREENAGRTVQCPACKQQLRVPDAPPAAIQPEQAREPAPAPSRVQRERPALQDELDADDRPRRRGATPSNSGKAIASLVLGILSMCGCSCLTGLPSILLGILSLRDISQAAGALTGKPMAIIGIILGSFATLCYPLVGIPAWLYGKEAADRAAAVNNLRELALAMHNYNDTQGRLPSAGMGNPFQPGMPPPNQKPLLSWRVALLPYLGEDTLYKQFKLDEPWDGPNNVKLLAKMPKVYKLPGDSKTPADHTVFQVFTGPNTLFPEMGGARIPASVPDGTSNTVLIVEASKGVPWTKPEDIPYRPPQPIAPLLGGHFRSTFLVSLVDGTVRILPQNTPETTLNAMITPAGGEITNWP
jgi:hypothetical protein